MHLYRQSDRLPSALAAASRTRSGWRRTALLSPLVLAVVVGCAKDARISLADLLEREQTVRDEVVAVPVETSQLALTDYRPYTLRPTDIIVIEIMGLLEDPWEATVIQTRVHTNGEIYLPAVGGIHVAGLTLGEVEEAVIEAHKKAEVMKTDLSAYVELSSADSTTVLVTGAANAPGLVRLEHNQRNILYALSSAEGFGPQSSGFVRLKPIRPERSEVVYNFNDTNDVRLALMGPPLESGDMIYVETAGTDTQTVYVTGLVNAPGPVRIPPGSDISVLRAVASAGGIQPYISPREATLVRDLPNGEQVHVRLDIGDMLAGKTPDIALHAGDVLHVPQTTETFFQDWVFKNILIGPFGISVRYDPLQQYNTNRALRDDGNNFSDAVRQSISSTVIPGLITPPTGN